MTTTAVETFAPVPVVPWGNDHQWLNGRARGISASDIAAILGYSNYATPWEVWAEKTGLRPRSVDADKECIRLGVAIEPWLLVQARHSLGVPVVHTDARLYAHPQAQWQLASPDGEARPPGGEPFGIECKTAGLASGFGVPKGWTDDQIPLGYQLQCHWQMRVMGWSKVVVVALVAGLGLRFYTIRRDLQVQLDLVEQVADWYRAHVVEGEEPPIGAADNRLMDSTWPEPEAGGLPLDDDPDIIELVCAYQSGLASESRGRTEKEAAAAQIKRRLGRHAAGTIGGREVITWRTRRGNVRWRDLLTSLYEAAGRDPDDIDADADQYRNPPTRTIAVKGIS